VATQPGGDITKGRQRSKEDLFADTGCSRDKPDSAALVFDRGTLPLHAAVQIAAALDPSLRRAPHAGKATAPFPVNAKSRLISKRAARRLALRIDPVAAAGASAPQLPCGPPSGGLNSSRLLRAAARHAAAFPAAPHGIVLAAEDAAGGSGCASTALSVALLLGALPELEVPFKMKPRPAPTDEVCMRIAKLPHGAIVVPMTPHKPQRRAHGLVEPAPPPVAPELRQPARACASGTSAPAPLTVGRRLRLCYAAGRSCHHSPTAGAPGL
jgi:hypothetical protein